MGWAGQAGRWYKGDMDEPLPSLRPELAFMQAEVDGRQVIVVQDPLELLDGLVLLDMDSLAVLPLFDGAHTLADLMSLLTQASGGVLTSEADARRIVDQLDGLLLLRSERYAQAIAGLRADWEARTVRPAAHAGQAYPADPAELAALLDEILAQAADAAPAPDGLRALVAPHIDPRVGAAGYAQAHALLKGRRFERVVVLGTGHRLDRPYAVCAKAYQTPLGTSAVDVDAVAALTAAAGQDPIDDFFHRDEHSIEFQALFLHHLLGEAVPLVPVLCGSLAEYLEAGVPVGDIGPLFKMARALRAVCTPDTLVVAGVDFSHVGPKFGHGQPATDYELKFRAYDQNLLKAIEQGSADALWAEALRTSDRWHVCGLPALALLLSALPNLTGDVRLYDVWHEAATRSAVSYAAVCLSG